VADDPEQTFLAAIAANPNDAEARAVYADWLEERGDPRGDYLRLEALLHDGPARLLELTKQLAPSWLAAVTRRFDVVLVVPGPNKISVIKSVREVTGLGLKDAKDLVESPMPAKVLTALTFDDAHELASKFSYTGARVVVMPHVGPILGGYPTPDLAAAPLAVPAAHHSTQLLWIRRAEHARRIDAIKAVREVSGIGLREAKALIDAIYSGERRALSVHGSPEQLDAWVAVLRAACDVELG
jgi:uncharacterized protein (TIGR02996 family)